MKFSKIRWSRQEKLADIKLLQELTMFVDSVRKSCAVQSS